MTLVLDLQKRYVKIFLIVEQMSSQQETMYGIKKKQCLILKKKIDFLGPKNLFEPSPGKGFEIFMPKNGMKVGVLNLMGNVFMKKCEDVFKVAEKFMKKHKLKEHYDFLIVDFMEKLQVKRQLWDIF